MNPKAEKLMSLCVSCGSCTDACPSNMHGGIDPMKAMNGEPQDLSQCIVCGNCSRACTMTDPFTAIRLMIVENTGLRPSQSYLDTGFARPPAKDRCIPPVWNGDDAYIMLGCVVNSEVPFVEYAASRAMEALGIHASRLPKEVCCLHPPMFMGMPDGEKESIRKRMLEGTDGKDIVTLCAGCSGEMAPVRPGISHIVQFLYTRIDRLPAFERRIKVGMEPGCSASEFIDEMKAVLEAMNCEIVNDSFGCCGKNAPVRIPLMEEREAECADAEIIVVGCPNCLVKFDNQPDGLPVVHISELIAMAAGYPESLAFHRIDVRFRWDSWIESVLYR